MGVGTSTPLAKLEVNGDIKLTAASGAGISFADGTRQTTAAGNGVSSLAAANGSGLSVSATTGAVTLNSDTTVLQKRVASTCAGGSAIASINADGTVTCQTVGGGGAITLPVNWAGTATAPAGVVNVTDTTNGPANTNNGPPDPNTLPASIVGVASGTGITVGVVGKATGPDGVGVIGISTQSEAPALVAWSQATGLSNDATALNAMLANAGGKVVDAQSTATSGQVTAFRGKLASPNATGLELDFATPPAWIINTNNNSFSVDGTGTVNASGLHLSNNGAIMFPDGTRQTTASTGGGGTAYTAGQGLSLNGNQFSNSGVLAVNANGVLSSSGGQNPVITLSGTVPVSSGGTGLSSTGPVGTFLRSNGASWASGAIQLSDLPSMSANYVDLNGTQTIAGTKTFSSAINANITGNANTVTNGVYTVGAYVDPSWLTSLNAGKLAGTLTKMQIPAATVYTDQANRFTAGTQDFSGAAATLPFRAVLSSATPANCVPNKEVIVKTDAPAGQQLFQCNGTGNGWNMLGSAGVALSSPDNSITVGGSGTSPTVALNVAATDARYAPVTGSSAYAPASGSPSYAPASGSANYAPMSGSTNYLAKTGDAVTLAANGLQMAGNQLVMTGGQFGYGAAPDTAALFDIAGSFTAPTYTAHLLQVDGTAKANGGYAQAYLRGIYVAPTFDVTSGYANYLVGVETYMGGKVGNNVAHSVVGYHLNGQPTSGQECSVGFGISVPNQQTSLCNGKYGFYQGDTAAQYNYFASSVGIGTPFPTQPLTVQGNMQINGTGNKLYFPDGTSIGSATGLGSTYTAGSGLTLASNQFSVNYAGNGAAATASRSDHNHDTAYAPITGSTNYAPILGSTNYLAKAGDTMTGTLTVPLIVGPASAAFSISAAPTKALNIATPNLGSSSGNGGAINITAGQAGTATGGAGGDVNITAGYNVPAGGGGWSGVGPAGNVNITAGGGYNTVGGNVTITSGPSSTWALGGPTFSKASLKGGIANTGDGATIDVEGGHTPSSPSGPAPSSGGNVVIKGGNGQTGGIAGSNMPGGSITVTAGNAVGTSAGGNIVLTPGTGSTNGTVQIAGNLVNVSGTGAMPVYNNSGTAQNAAHMITGTLNFAGGSAAVNLSGAAVFSSVSSYVCTVTGSTVQPFGVTNNAGNSFTISGPADPAVKYICVGI